MLISIKYQVAYEDTEGRYKNVLFSAYPDDAIKKEYKISKILDIRKVRTILKRDRDKPYTPDIVKPIV